MAYDFSVPSQTPARSVRAPDASSREPERTVLYGTDMEKCRIPQETALPGSGCQVAFADRQNRAFGLNEELLSKHLLLLGGIGCGKTNVFNFLVESLQRRMTNRDVMLIFDTKGDFFRSFYRPGNPAHWVIGNDARYAGVSRSWNIFDEMRDESGGFGKESELIAKEIAKQLFIGRESSAQPFFSQAAADLVSKVLIHLMREATAAHRERSLNTEQFVSFLKTADIQKYYDMTAHPRNRDFVSAQLYFGRPDEKLTAQALGVFGYINAMVNDLFVGVFAENCWAGSYSMRQLVREKGRRVVFVEYDLKMGETLGPMYRLMFDLALKDALGGRREDRGNTYVIIDEFKLLPDLRHIDDALNFGRSLGVKICAGLQSIDQLFEIYGEDRGKVLAAGFMNCFCFRTSDLSSREYIKGRFGQTYENLAFHSRSAPVSVQREGHVVEDWDLLRLEVGQAYISLVGHPPFLFRFSDFDEPHTVL